MNPQESMAKVLVQDNVIAASTGCALYGNIHAGRVDVVPSLTAYSMSPLCARYVKANGEELALHQKGRYPSLTRGFPYPFADLRDGRKDAGKLCKYCVLVFDADQAGMPVQDYVRLSQEINRAMRTKGGAQ
jgi:hypothetical protein